MVASKATGEDERPVVAPEIDRVFHALADATRRDILRRCAGDQPSVSRLAEAYPMSFTAVHKHVAVLARAGLVTKERSGREQLVHTNTDALHRARQSLDQLEETWRGRVGRMAHVLAQIPDPEENNPIGEDKTDERHQH